MQVDGSIEAALLGVYLYDPTACQAAPSVIALEPRDFGVAAHELIFAAIRSLESRGEPVDLLSVQAYLADLELLDQAGGPEYLAGLGTGDIMAIGTIDQHAQRIQRSASTRRLLQGARDVLSRPQPTPETLIAGLGELIETAVATDRSVQTLRTIDDIGEAYDSAGAATPLLTGLGTIDRRLSLRRGEVIVLAAEPGHGKSALGLDLVFRFARQGRNIAVISCEMTAIELYERLLASTSGIPNADIRREITDPALRERIDGHKRRLRSLPIWIDQGAPTVESIAAATRRLKKRSGLDAILVDYVQIVTPTNRSGATREQEVAHISRSLKQLAKELDCVVFLLSQLNDDGKVRESRAIHQDADVVLKLSIVADGGAMSLMTVSVDKNRHGAKGYDFRLAYHGPTFRFSDLDAG